MSNTSGDIPDAFDESMREEAAIAGRAALEAALQRFSHEQRDAFWNAVGLYYATRRHPGPGESPADIAAAPAA